MEGVPGNNLELAFRPVEPEGFDRESDFLKMNTWLYRLVQFFTPVRSTSKTKLSEEDMVTSAASLSKDGAAVWLYTLQVSDRLPGTWTEFEVATRDEFIPEGHERGAREQLRNYPQSTTVSKYIHQFRHAVLLVPNLSAGDKWDNFVEGLKPAITFEVCKDNCMTFDEAARVALRVEAAINGSRRTASVPMSNEPTPMEIGNVETRKGHEKKKLTDEEYALVRKMACFIWKKKGCLSWKHSNKNATVNAIYANLSEDFSETSLSESEN